MSEKDERARRREFFAIHPDYAFCRVLAANVSAGIITHAYAVEQLYNKASQTAALRDSIRDVLDKKKVSLDGQWRLLKDLTLEEIGRLDDKQLAEVLHFYFKYPTAHQRIAPPALFRSRASRLQFLLGLLDQVKRRALPVDVPEWEEMLSLL